MPGAAGEQVLNPQGHTMMPESCLGQKLPILRTRPVMMAGLITSPVQEITT